MKRVAGAVLCALALAACAKAPPPPVETAKPPAPPPQVHKAARTEPVFYNGQQYLLKYTYDDSIGVFKVRVSGSSKPLGSGDQAVAQDIASGALRHFACPKNQTGKIRGAPVFSDGVWRMTARCG